MSLENGPDRSGICFTHFFKASGLQLPLEFIVQCDLIPRRHLTTSLNIWYVVFLFVFFQIFCNDAKNVSDYWNLLITRSEIKSELSVKHNPSRRPHSLHGTVQWVRDQPQPARVAPTRAGGVLFLARRALAQSLSRTTAGASRSVPASATSLRAVVDLPWSDSRALVT